MYEKFMGPYLIQNIPTLCTKRLGIYHSCEVILNSDLGLQSNSVHKKYPYYVICMKIQGAITHSKINSVQHANNMHNKAWY